MNILKARELYPLNRCVVQFMSYISIHLVVFLKNLFACLFNKDKKRQSPKAKSDT